MIVRIRLQTEYMGTGRMKITVHGMYLDITVDHVGVFFANFGQVGDVVGVLSKVDGLLESSVHW